MADTERDNLPALAPLLVDEDRAEELKQASMDVPSITLSQRQLCDLELLMCGAFTPLAGFMDQKNYDQVLGHSCLAHGSVGKPVATAGYHNLEAARRDLRGG